MFLSIAVRVCDSALESHGTLASGFHSQRVPNAAPTTITCPTIPGNLAAEFSGDSMSCCVLPVTFCFGGLPMPKTRVPEITCPSTADSTVVDTV